MTHTADGPGPAWRTTEWFMLRLAGMPIETAQALRFGESTAWADAVLDAEADLAARAPGLSDALHQVISERGPAGGTGGLVALRRDVHNNRRPRDPSGARQLLRDLPDGTRTALEAWLEDRAALDDLVRGGAGRTADELRRRRATLREAAAHPRLRQGLVLASTTLDTYLGGYLTGPDKLSKRERRIERSLLEYVYRTSAKTSPFSSFTGVAVGRFDPAADRLLVGRVDETWSGRARVNVAVISRLIAAIVENTELLADLTVRLTPGWSVDLDRVRFVRRTSTPGDDAATVGFDTVRDSLFYLQRSGILQEIVTALEPGRPVPVRVLTGYLAELTGEDPATGLDYVRLLVRVGLLWVPDLRADVHADDPLPEFSASLRRLGRPWADTVAERLDGVAGLLRDYPSASLERRRQVVQEVRVPLLAALAEVGSDAGSLPHTLVFEDTSASASVVAAGVRTWERAVAPALNRLADVLPAFDLNLPHQLVLRSFFRARHGAGGRCDDVLRFLYEFGEDIHDEYNRVSARKPTYDDRGVFTGHENWLAEPGLEAVNRCRTEFGAAVRSLWEAHDPASAVLELPDELMDRLGAILAPLRGNLRPQGYFAQLAGTEAAPELVINKAMSGLSFAFSRFTHCFGDVGDGRGLAETVREWTREVVPEGAVLAEVVGGVVNSNLNIHAPMTDYQLLCPAESSSFPVEAQITFDDLYLVHDVPSDRLVLRSKRLDREVIPVYLGYLVPTALPDVARSLLLLSPMGMAMLDIWGGVPSATGTVTGRPRVSYRNVVLSRRNWAVHSRDLPARATGQDDAAWLLGWRRWQREHGLPDQVFATFPAEPSEEDEPGWTRRTKPMYVDFTSLFSLTVLDAAIRRAAGSVQLEEMYPAEDDLYVESAEGRHVCELAIESTRRPLTEIHSAPVKVG